MKRSRIYILCVLVAGLGWACSADPKANLVGKWQEVEADENTIEFEKEGTVKIVSNGIAMAGKYTFEDPKRLQVNFDGMAALLGPMDFSVAVSRSDLAMTDKSGSTVKFKKAR